MTEDKKTGFLELVQWLAERSRKMTKEEREVYRKSIERRSKPLKDVEKCDT